MLGKRIKSFKFAFKGIISMFRSEPNARIHLVAMVLVIAAGFYFSIQPGQWIALVLCIGFVFAAEAFNTALEALTDLVSPEFHPLAEKAKDVAAAAVLISAITAIIVGLFVFLPELFSIIK
ncbi:MAG: diacylglycerol kinase family protein [Saprospiraceae bacterium]|nr:diacylglycerol kinase family protein [Saprospiraceae bacterium]MCB9326553.1 diacylglycerol kinase family protein [Lewinellaceae bacterium]